jgi:hypothetical protein
MILQNETKYIIYTCPKCKTSLALEVHKTKKCACPHIIAYTIEGKPIRCGEVLPTQKERDNLEIIQFHIMEIIS